MPKNLMIWLAVLATILGNPLRAQELKRDLLVGAAKVDITPSKSSLGPSGLVRDRLFARAIYIDDGHACSVIVGLDQVGVGSDVFTRASEKISKEIGCDPANLIVSATHTHSAGGSVFGPAAEPAASSLPDAILKAARLAKKGANPARLGFATTLVDLNINRDLFEGGRWYQGDNREGPSDKTLSILYFIDDAGMPIAVFVNYAMHPINFFLSGVVSADFPGEVSRYIEGAFASKPITIFSQGAAGDQNPRLTRPMHRLIGIRTRTAYGYDDRINAPSIWKRSSEELNAFERQSRELAKPLDPADKAAFSQATAHVSAIVSAEGAIIGEAAIDAIRNRTSAQTSVAPIHAELRTVTCNGRERVDSSAREGILPSYRDTSPVSINVGLLRFGEVNLITVNGEVYSGILARLKAEAPTRKLMMVTSANGDAGVGYIYSDEAASHLTFQVIGSRLVPGCAEQKIVAASNSMLGEASPVP